MFELSIKCSKDISKLKIDFADGSSTVSTVSSVDSSNKEQINEQIKEQNKIHKSQPKEKFLNTDEEFDSVFQEVVKLPDIKIKNRPVNVASEMQNLDF
jgi:hypothetical protein